MTTFLNVLRRKIIVFDGATGTHLQSQNLTPDDFGGEHLAGCNEILVMSKPSAVEKVHQDYLEAGCDVIETDTFGGTSLVLAEYGLQEQTYDLNRKAAEIARSVASSYGTGTQPRFVAGSMGPTTKLPSLGHVGFKAMAEAYRVQAKGLMDGGVDLLSIETCQDVLQAKAALYGVHECFREAGRRIPVIVSVTIETMGTMLLGTEISAALTAIEPFDVDIFGINCATGPKEMSEHVRVLSKASPMPVFVMPNAGIPENVGGVAHYHLSPEELDHYMSTFVKDLGVQVVGGCCGTTKEHIRRLVQSVGSLEPAPRSTEFLPAAASLYQASPFRVDSPPVLIGERTNANGSKMFRELLAREDWEGIVAMGKEQVSEQAHMQDVCVAYVGRDEMRDMREVISRFNTQIATPLLIDSTEPPAIETALQLVGGKAVVNSINLEDGESRLGQILGLCKQYGAAVIALTIDERGMAKTANDKVGVAERIYDLATNKYGMKPHDLIFDALTFTLGSGDEEFRSAGKETLEAIRHIKKKFPAVHTVLGVSNISFGLSPQSRQVLNSVFLHYAVEAGLDMAIVHASKIVPLYKIDEEGREIARRIIFDERAYEGSGSDRKLVSDPLRELIAFYSGKKSDSKKTDLVRGSTIEERLKNRIIDGVRVGLQKDLDTALKSHPPLEIINSILLNGMKVVGDLFASGEMQLPFVLQSAEVMKAAVAYLEPFMEKKEGTHKGTMVIATVKGDVHDIGKNLVDIILTNNGYRVVNLGIKCPVETMLGAVEEHKADALGMSGLLVKSTLVMRENLEVINERSLRIPVILGGAALTRRYVEQDLRNIYRGSLSYAADAFDGLRFMERVAAGETPRSGGGKQTRRVESDQEATGAEAKIELAMNAPEAEPAGRSGISQAAVIPLPPFWGSRVVEDVSLDDIYRYVNEIALIRGQWRVVRGKMSQTEYDAVLKEKVYPDFEALKLEAKLKRLLEPKVVYGYYPCQSDGDSIVVYDPAGVVQKGGGKAIALPNPKEITRFNLPRQRKRPHLCLADYFAPVRSNRMDVVAFHLVTMGAEASHYSKRLFDSDNYKQYLYFHGLSVESAEALAELWHKRIREELGIAADDAADVRKLFAQKYQGARYSFGYPACPNLEDQAKLFSLLQPERIGVRLTEGYQLDPEQSTSALIVHHPEARYFTIT